MKPARKAQPTVLVTDAGRGSALSFVRSLGRAGYRVIAADCDPSSIGFRSRLASGKLIYPAPTEQPLQYVAAMLQAVETFGVDLVIPITDESLLPLSESRGTFPETCRLAVADADVLEITTNKLKTMHLAQRLGVPLPRTVLVTSVDEALEAAQELERRPLVLKPNVSRLYRDESSVEKLTVCYANDLDTLAREMRRFEGRCPVLLQEYAAGTGLGVELLLHRGRPLAAFQHRRLREYPVSGGASSLRESVPLDPLLYDYALRLMSELQWTGLAMVEFKVGTEGPMLMEINGRVWGSLPLAVRSGVDFPLLLAETCFNGPPPQHELPSTKYRTGVRARNLDLDVLWMLTVLLQRRQFPCLPLPRRGAAIRALLGLLNPRMRSDVASWSDPLPGLLHYPRLIRKLLGKAAKERSRGDESSGAPATESIAGGEIRKELETSRSLTL